MRSINIANTQRRDATVNFDVKNKESNIEYVLSDGRAKSNIKILKNTTEQDLNVLLAKHGSLEKIAKVMIKEDPEFDLEKTGLKLERTNKLYVTKDYKILYGVKLFEIKKNPEGEEIERNFYAKKVSNINIDFPIRCTGKKIAKEEAVKKFVFSRKYQIKHINGLTYDFLYAIASELSESNSLMFAGGGEKGTEPLIFHDGGVPYRCFLEGRVKAEKYCLILHLTNLELKELSS